ncbi:MAG: hypothetical protein AAF617_09775 [Bacteroidota bacterium]
MLQSILNVNGASIIGKKQQKEIQGGLLELNLRINQECTLATQGEPCGPPHCPGICGVKGFDEDEPYCFPF